MKSNIRIIILLIVALSSCQKRDWNNPFDPECPKESWTPTDFASVQQVNAINLTWVQAEKNISGFRLERKIEGETAWKEVVSPEKATNSWADQNIAGGKLYEYRIVALAGSNESNFATVQIKPLLTATLTTAVPSSITATSATLGGTITTDGGAPITERGVCWATTTAPTTSNIKLAIGSGTGSFSNSISGLTANTTYYVRAYAINSQGIAYGNQESFTTLEDRTMPPGISETITDIDGNVYNTVTIGTQVWMAENLKTTKYNDGTAIPNVTSATSWAGLTTGAYCWYNNDVTYKNTYGALYNWYAINTNKLTPIGWHVPTDAEWTTLTTYLGGESVAGGKLKEVGTTHWLSPNSGATNVSGFTALPSGSRQINGLYGYFSSDGHWWSSNEYNTNNSWYRTTDYSYSSVLRNSTNKYYGLSVRCIKD